MFGHVIKQTCTCYRISEISIDFRQEVASAIAEIGVDKFEDIGIVHRE